MESSWYVCSNSTAKSLLPRAFLFAPKAGVFSSAVLASTVVSATDLTGSAGAC